MPDVQNPPVPAPTPVQPALFEPPAPAPAPAPAGGRSPAEIEKDLLEAKTAVDELKKALGHAKDDKRKTSEQLSAARQGLVAAGLIAANDPADAKEILEKHERNIRIKERREAAIDRAAMRKLVGTNISEDEADMVLAKIIRDPRVSFDEATGTVSGLDEVFTALKPTIERLSGKPVTTPPAVAPPAPPAPSNAAAPMEPEFQGIKTWNDLMAKTITGQERFETNHPAEFKRLESEWNQSTKRGKPVVTQPSGQAQRM